MHSFTLLLDPESLLLDPADGVRHTLARVAAEHGRDEARAWHRAGDRVTDLRAVLADLLGLAPAEPRLALALARYRELYLAEGRYHARLRPEMVCWLAGLADEPGLTRLYLSHLGPAATLRLMETFELHRVIDRLFVAADALAPGQRAGLLRGLLDRGTQGAQGVPGATREAATGLPPGPRLDPRRLLLLSDMPHELLLARRLGVAALPLGFGRSDPALLTGPEVATDVCDVARWVRARRWGWSPGLPAAAHREMPVATPAPRPVCS